MVINKETGDYSIKGNYNYLNKRKQVIQNYSISFRPTNEEKKFLELNINSNTELIHKALNLLITLSKHPRNLLRELKLKYPFEWKKINRNTYY